MKNNKSIIFTLLIISSLFTIQSCKPYLFRSNYQDSNKLLHESNNIETKLFLKAHLKNGDVCILKDSWQIDTIQNLVIGNGSRYDFNRNESYSGDMIIPIDSVLIFETNKKILNPEDGRIATLAILAGVDIVIGVLCITNPKACFGSCPTFYLNPNDNFHYADAEGFTNAISPSMEYFDIDALNNKPIIDKSFSITMKNEALETHCVNEVKLLAYSRKKGERVYQSPKNDFYLCENNYSSDIAIAKEGNISTLIRNVDMQERFSLSDENNLNSKEEIYLNFDDIKNLNDLGLIAHFRQTMMTTYTFYSGMGYMGDQVGYYFSKLEKDEKSRANFDVTAKILGNIDVYLWNESKKSWEFQGAYEETGPIAINKQIIPLKNIPSNAKVRLKLVLNKGLWRIDFLSLTNIKEKVKPIEISPSSVLNKGKVDNNALALINNPDNYLISMPGSEYKFNFTLPNQSDDYELFLYSKGYYLEWMREHWLKDKNLLKLRQMAYQPKRFLKVEAKNYKKYEKVMEQEFWNSKIDTKIFSYYEY